MARRKSKSMKIDTTELEVVQDAGGVLVYRDHDGRLILGTDSDGRTGDDLVGQSLEPHDKGE
jgi:hypothetical protein